jgi:hypothetical protein
LNGPYPVAGPQTFRFTTLNGGHYGKEEKEQEGGEEKEKEEGSRTQGKKEIVEETRKKSGQEKSKAESGREGRDETSGSNGGIDEHGVLDDAGRGENRPEPRSRVALSDGLEALERVADQAALSPGTCASD